MNCFVIMPFSKEFDDVYATIKANVEPIISPQGGKCFRLDETRPAGAITNRLLREIQEATFCIADVTGNKPNVMWEVGYAMALRKPIILTTQKISELPFDIKDLQSLEYDRSQVSRTLGEQLKKIVLDTIQTLASGNLISEPIKEREELVSTLLTEIIDLKNVIGNIVQVWSPPAKNVDLPESRIKIFEGTWVSDDGSHFYAKVINGSLVVPYCFSGNDRLTAVFYDWRQTGEYWFTRFIWLNSDISGFAFLKQDSLDSLIGAWWADSDEISIPVAPPSEVGVPLHWIRNMEIESPHWANNFFDEVQKTGLSKRIVQRKMQKW